MRRGVRLIKTKRLARPAKGSIPKAFAFTNKRQPRHSVFTNGSLAYKEHIEI
jgi:hypothetical protein